MAENSGIEWTDHTFNPWIGCTKVSPACKNCYAERDFDHRYGKVQWGPLGTRKVTSEANWRKPRKWSREASMWRYCDCCGEPFSAVNPCSCDRPKAGAEYRPRVFCASLADVFEDWDGEMHDHQGNAHFTLDGDPLRCVRSPDAAGCDLDGYHYTTMDDVRQRLFDLIDSTPNLDWLLLTKRPENIRRMWLGGYRHNVWLGTSVENQEFANKRIPELLGCRDLSPVLFLSCEPLVEPVNLRSVNVGDCPKYNCLTGKFSLPGYGMGQQTIDWVITGGESGPNARACDANWFRSLRDQCLDAGVPFHFKQWGEFDENMNRIGKKKAGRLLDGETHDGVPVVTATKA